jgi:hypothetical protein
MPKLVFTGITDSVAHAGIRSVDEAMQLPIEKSNSLLFIIIFLNFGTLNELIFSP